MSKKSINIIIACEIYLYSEGLKLIIENEKEFNIIGIAESVFEIKELTQKYKADILILNLSNINKSIQKECLNIKSFAPDLPILLFFNELNEVSVPELIVNGVRGIIWQGNSNNDLIEAIYKLSNGELFFENPDNCKLNCKLSSKLHNCKSSETKLSVREQEVLKLISEGNSFKQIGDKLCISPRTVETHKNNMMKKLNLANTSELIRYGLVNEL